jgi:2-polyprenyl-6-hydroxyphenyl methylase/3-demethylubiquinone-9 3-methyltransferase
VRGYYEEGLSGERLRRCYELAPPRVRRYLDAEVAFTLERVAGATRILELGCGYGRVLGRIAGVAAVVVGVDTSIASLTLARAELGSRTELALMDAADLGFADGAFDAVVCVQNGLSAFHADQRRVIAEALRVLSTGGVALFSSYTDAFWEHRLEWFRIQARNGLVGEIDESATGDGRIVCRDGFTATTIRPDDFRVLLADRNVEPEIVTVDDSSLLCVATA